MGKILSKSFEKRMVGDYSFVSEISKKDAEKVLNWTRDFLSKIKEYLIENGFIK
jgi:uncharacterized protein (UPF0332 family)